MNTKELKLGIIYYVGSCGCIIEKSKVIKRKRYNKENQRLVDVNACPAHPKLITQWVIRCVDCGKATFRKPVGRFSVRCKKHRIEYNKKADVINQRNQRLKRTKIREDEARKKEKEKAIIQAKKNNTFINPVAAFTVEQAALRGVCCIQSDNLFIFNGLMRHGKIDFEQKKQ